MLLGTYKLLSMGLVQVKRAKNEAHLNFVNSLKILWEFLIFLLLLDCIIFWCGLCRWKIMLQFQKKEACNLLLFVDGVHSTLQYYSNSVVLFSKNRQPKSSTT